MSASKGALHPSYGTYPVTMYDVDNQKPVAIFKSGSYASQYVFSKPSTVNTRTIVAKRKYSPTETNYSVTITFRSATPEQKMLLADKESVILDNSYLNKDIYRKERIKKERGKADVKPSVYNSIKEERNAAIEKLLKEGYTKKEISKKLNIPGNTHIVEHVQVINIHSRASVLSVGQLKEMKTIIENRIKLLEEKQ